MHSAIPFGGTPPSEVFPRGQIHAIITTLHRTRLSTIIFLYKMYNTLYFPEEVALINS